MLTVPEIIAIAKVSGYLAASDTQKSLVYGTRLDPRLSQMIFCERKAVEWMYEQDSTDDSLQKTANYLYAICGKYALLAQRIISGGAGGSVGGNSGDDSDIFPIYITNDDFNDDGVSYDDERILELNLVVYVNEINRFIYGGYGFYYTATGIQIRADEEATIPGFDASTNEYSLLIYRVTKSNNSFPLYVRSSDFATATQYDNEFIIGKNIRVYLDSINRFLTDEEYEFAGDGINILLAGFDAETNNYNIIIQQHA